MTQTIIIASTIFVLTAIVVMVVTFTKKPYDKTAKHGGKVAALASNLKIEQLKTDIILSAINDGVILVDANGTIYLFNEAAGNICGWSTNDAIGLNHHSVLEFVDEKGVAYDSGQNPFDKVFVSGTPVHDNSAYLKTHAGKIISVYVSASPLTLDGQGKISGVIAIFRDVSEERQAEKQRAEFISTASHEMRTPVAAIEGYLALALNEKVATIDQKARDYLVKAHESTQSLGKLFQDLLTAAKSEDGRLSNHPTVVECNKLVSDIVSGVRFAAEKKGLIMNFDLGAGAMGDKVVSPLYYVFADPERLREVITNLFDNAVKYTDKGSITIGLTGDDKFVQIRVTDTGQGIPKEDLPHLFQKFYRVDNSATRTIGGTGLGLFICRKIVELYSGRVWVESEVGKGSTFYINIARLTQAKANQLLEAEKNTAPPPPNPVETV